MTGEDMKCEGEGERGEGVIRDEDVKREGVRGDDKQCGPP